MAISYLIQYPCKVRESMSDQDLVRMQMARIGANGFAELTRGAPRISTEFFAQSKHCDGCPANLQKKAFGCGGTINYPIAEEAEQWLMSRLPEDLKTLSGQILLLVVNEFRFDGARIDAERQRGMIYAAEKPVIRKWGFFFAKRTWLSSSQVLQMLIGSGSLSPVHAGLVCWFLGFLDAEMQPESRPDNLVASSDARSIAEFKVFLSAVAFAGANNYRLLVDV